MFFFLFDDYVVLKYIFCEFFIEIDIIMIIEMFLNCDYIKCDYFKNLKWLGFYMVWGSNIWWVIGFFGIGCSE